nr:putative secreted glycosidase [Quercus suber]
MIRSLCKTAGTMSCHLLLVALAASAAAAGDLASRNYRLIDPLIGSLDGGNVFAGASLPYGMAKAAPDVSGQNTAGWAADGSNVTGFSALHDSGTGGQPSLGKFPLSIQPACAGDVLEGCRFGSKYARAVNYVNGSARAEPGYFALALDDGVRAEMTVTEHAALFRFHVPSTNGSNGTAPSPVLLLDLTDLQDSRQNASISVDGDTGRMRGNGTFLPSFGVGSYQAYFCVDFRGAAVRETGVWVNERAGTEPKELFVNRGYSLFYIQAGAFVRFATPPSGTITTRIGVSFLSSSRACRNAEHEIADWDFDATRSAARDGWKAKFANIEVQPGGASIDLQKTFFTGIYRTMLSPQNYSNENPLWASAEPYFDSFYCIWDSFRTDFPWLTIFDPSALSEMIRSLLDTYTHLGWLPDCRMQFCKGFSQGGSNADVVLADAFVKNLSNTIDWELAYRAVENDAENEPFDWGVNGRGELTSWKHYGYIPVLDYDPLGFGPAFHSVSRTLEYAYNDYAVAVIARGLNKEAEYEKYLARSGNWLKLFKADQASYWPNGTAAGNFTGFFQPRYANGTWRFQDPIECSPLDEFCSYSSNPKETFESSLWEYQFYVPQDQATLIRQLGGASTFIRRLDYLHESGLLDIGNEPSELTCYQYHYAGRPGLSAQRIRTYIPSSFNASINGLPGNDDSGASGSFVAFALAGLFPVAGQDVYLITPPFFDSVSFTHPLTRQTATIRTMGHAAGAEQVFVQHATLDGEAYTRNWIGHDFFLSGGVLELVVGGQESAWGTAEAERPPSAAAAVGPYRAGDGWTAPFRAFEIVP